MIDDKEKIILQNKFLQQSLTDVGKAFATERASRQALEKVIEKDKENNKIPLVEGKKMNLEHSEAWRQLWKTRYEKEKKKCQDLENEMRETNKKIKELEKEISELTNPVPQLRKDGL